MGTPGSTHRQPRYVGKTSRSAVERLCEHIADAYREEHIVPLQPRRSTPCQQLHAFIRSVGVQQLCIVPLQVVDCDLQDTHLWEVVSRVHERFWIGVLQTLWSQANILGLNMQLPGSRAARFGDAVYEVGGVQSLPLWSPYFYYAYHHGELEVVGSQEADEDRVQRRYATRDCDRRVQFFWHSGARWSFVPGAHRGCDRAFSSFALSH